ncbi:MAG: squalene/phytoene synthase family protein [Deltaproteobacteria bacterium]|nr:squalene/phytoene synthase family protein [Deltaproteobacteria bacterium]
MANLDELLVKTSRTFALAIPLLPEPCKLEVTIAYLLFRIADTFEDAAVWPREQRLAALGDFAALLSKPDPVRALELTTQWSAARPIEHEGYLELLAETPAVLEALASLSPSARHIVTRHAIRTTEGMAEVVQRTDNRGNLQLRDVEDLKSYCYIVAGIVGELLTELFILDAPQLHAVAGELNQHAIAFGEALQLVNILKDSDDDAEDGRVFLPPKSERGPIFELAREDLRCAKRYVAALHEAEAPAGFLAFTSLPVLLAQATLDRVEALGPGAKVERGEVVAMMAHVHNAIDHHNNPLAI